METPREELPRAVAVEAKRKVKKYFNWMGMTGVYEAFKITYPKGAVININNEKFVTFKKVTAKIYSCPTNMVNYLLLEGMNNTAPKFTADIFRSINLNGDFDITMHFDDRVETRLTFNPIGIRPERDYIVLNVKRIKAEFFNEIGHDSGKSKVNPVYEWER